MSIKMIMRFFIFLLLLWGFSTTLCAQSSTDIRQLEVLVLKQQLLQKQVVELEKNVKHPRGALKTKKQLIEELDRKSKELEQTDSYFRYIASGVRTEKKDRSGKRNIWKEVENLINPVVNVLGRISERPRKIEKIRYEVEATEQKMQQLQSGREKLGAYFSQLQKGTLLNRLRALDKEYEQEYKTLELTKKQLLLDLDKLVDSKESLISVWSKTLFHFFKTKGINLFIAFMVFSLFWFLLIQLKKKVMSWSLLRGQAEWAARPLNVLYTSLIFLFALLMSIIVLYIRNDWFLVTLIIIFIVGFAWSIKQWIPQFISKGKLLLNLGPIREKELITWKGVPYQIDKLSYFSTLVNPVVSGGTLRISIDELARMHSRPVREAESWFPTEKGEWVELSDGEYGEVIDQSPEYVKIRSYKGHVVHYTMNRFLAFAPKNYSHGLMLELPFIFSLKETKRFKEGLLNKLEKSIEKALDQFQGWDIELRVAAIRSGEMELFVCARNGGEDAKSRFTVKHLIYRTLVNFMLQEQIEFAKQYINVDIEK